MNLPLIPCNDRFDGLIQKDAFGKSEEVGVLGSNLYEFGVKDSKRDLCVSSQHIQQAAFFRTRSDEPLEAYNSREPVISIPCFVLCSPSRTLLFVMVKPASLVISCNLCLARLYSQFAFCRPTQ